jgi:signal transduction histidine kinase
VKEIKNILFIYPISLAFLLLLSNLLSANIFVNSDFTFLVWFVLMLVAFFIGWFINSSFKWLLGIKVVFISIISAILLSFVIILFFGNSFSINNSLIGNIVLFSIRIFVLGSISIFGISISENFNNRQQNDNLDKPDENSPTNNVENADLLIREAKLKAEKLLFDAEKEYNAIKERKMQIEIQLRELIHTEREVIRNYENISTSEQIDSKNIFD